LETRFWSHVDRQNSDDCWEWRGTRIRGGYGHLYIGHHGGKPQLALAHRISWLLTHGEWIDGTRQIVRHRCDNPPCVNPDHLELGSYADNMRDMRDRGRERKLRGSQAPWSKLTERDVTQIVALHQAGTSWRCLAETFGVSTPTIADIFAGRSWAHLTGLKPA